MSERQRKAHIVAEAAALISGLFLIVVSFGLPFEVGWPIGSAGIGVVAVDCFFIFSWRWRGRSRRMVYLHIIAEIMGVLCGIMLIYLAVSLKWSLGSLYIFCTGVIMCLIDALFVLTWIPSNGRQRIFRECRTQRTGVSGIKPEP